MAPEDSWSRNNRRFHPYHSYTDSPLKLLRRPADPNARSTSQIVSGGETQQDSTPSSSAHDSSTESSSDPPSHQVNHTQAEEDSTLGSSSNPIDLTNLVINSQTPPRKSVTSKNVAHPRVSSQPDLVNRNATQVQVQSKKTPVKQTVIQPPQRSREDLIGQNPAQSRAPSQQDRSNQNETRSRRCSHENLANQDVIQPQQRAHPNPIQNVQPRTPSRKSLNNKNVVQPHQPQAPSQPTFTNQTTTHPRMLPQKRPLPQNLTHPERPSQQRRLMPPPPPPVPAPNMSLSLPQQLHTSLQSQSLPLPSLLWLSRLVSSRQPPLPLASLLATTRARILAADLTTDGLLDQNYINSHSFPPNLSNPVTKSTVLSQNVVVQVLDIVNISKSKWEQVEEMEAKARGEEKRGREVIRVVDADGEGEGGPDQGTQAATQFQTQQQNRPETKATHKVLLQDPKGEKIFGLELFRVEKLGIGQTNIGEKWLLKKGMSVSRGVVMLEPGKCVYLGGKVEVWNKAWNEGRLDRLRRETVEGGERNGGQVGAGGEVGR